jgi:hypothetical protein
LISVVKEYVFPLSVSCLPQGEPYSSLPMM